jgi:hypothetical protein
MAAAIHLRLLFIIVIFLRRRLPAPGQERGQQCPFA